MSSRTGFTHTSGWAMILPTNSNGNFQNDSGISYPWLPDLPIARIMFLAGIAAAVLGLTGLPARAGGPGLRRAAAVAVAAGLALAVTATGLASSARLTAHGMAIPGLHDAASDAPIAYTPTCGHAAGVPVCLNPAYGRWLPAVTGALSPELAEVAGLPGAPARATQVATGYTGGPAAPPGPPVATGAAGPPQALTLAGQPAVLRLSLGMLNMPGPCGFCDGPVLGSQFAGQFRLMFAHAFVGAGSTPGSPAQQAVQAALLRGAGIPFAVQPKVMGTADNFPGPQPYSAAGPVFDAARRFAALPAPARHAWLAAHLAALRAGQLTLKDLP